MSVILYRPGKTHVIDGIECEMQVVEPHAFQSNIDAGWFTSPEKCYKPKKKRAVKKAEPKSILGKK